MINPSEIRLKKSKKAISIVFEDGNKVEFTAELLRVESPSAEVRGHSPNQKILEHGKKEVEITKIEPVGNYAISLNFSDGHNTGIYSWNFLYELMKNKEKVWNTYIKLLKEKNLKR